MGVCMMLVSDKDKVWFDCGKIFFEEKVVKKMKKLCKLPDREPLENAIVTALQDESFNIPSTPTEDALAAKSIAAWMLAHPDWRFLTEADEEFDDVYLAEDEAEAKEYQEEFGDDPEDEYPTPMTPIYMKSGSI